MFGFPEMDKIVEGRKVSELYTFYTVNVIHLETMTHEQFVQEFPEAAKLIEMMNSRMKKIEEIFK